MRCSIDGCDRAVYGRGHCESHNRRRRLYGDPLGHPASGPVTPPGAPSAYFEAHVDDNPLGCLLWPYGKTDGYGALNMPGGKLVRVHVLSCIHHHGSRPPRMDAAHLPILCHNRLCFKGGHLAWVSRKENSAHMVLDGTRITNEQKWSAKLTFEKAEEIRRMITQGETRKTVATLYGVHEGTVHDIIHDKRWVRS